MATRLAESRSRSEEAMREAETLRRSAASLRDAADENGSDADLATLAGRLRDRRDALRETLARVSALDARAGEDLVSLRASILRVMRTIAEEDRDAKSAAAAAARRARGDDAFRRGNDTEAKRAALGKMALIGAFANVDGDGEPTVDGDAATVGGFADGHVDADGRVETAFARLGAGRLERLERVLERSERIPSRGSL